MAELLNQGDEIIISNGRYTVPRIQKIDRVTATQAFVGPYKLKREVGSNGYLRELNKDRWSLRSMRLGTPETLAAVRTEAELADAREDAETRLNDALKKLHQARLADLRKLTDNVLAFIDATSAPSIDKEEASHAL